MIDLGTLGVSGSVRDINARGLVGSSRFANGESHATLWTR